MYRNYIPDHKFYKDVIIVYLLTYVIIYLRDSISNADFSVSPTRTTGATSGTGTLRATFGSSSILTRNL